MRQPPMTFELRATATTEPPWGWGGSTLSETLNRQIWHVQEIRALREMAGLGVPAIANDAHPTLKEMKRQGLPSIVDLLPDS